MKKYKTIRKKVEVIDKISCDVCNRILHEDSIIQISKKFGYFSDNLDNDTWELDICPECINNTFGDKIRKS